MSRFVTPDFIYHARGEDVKGTQKLKEWVSSDRSIFPDIRFTIVDSIAESNKVATAWFVEATHEKEFRGIPATHKKFEANALYINLVLVAPPPFAAFKSSSIMSPLLLYFTFHLESDYLFMTSQAYVNFYYMILFRCFIFTYKCSLY